MKTRKNKTINFLKKVFLSLVTLLFFSCVKDNLEAVIEPEKELSFAYVDINQVDAELSILKPVVQTHEMLSRSLGGSKKIRTVENKVNPLKDVLVVYEEESPLSYSISFENQSVERFANVVVVKDENNNSQTMVIEYAPDAESIRLYNTGRIGVDELSGTMYVYGSLEDYVDQTQVRKQPQSSGKTPLFFSDPCANVFNFNFGSGTMSGSGGGSSTETCEIVKIVIPCIYGGTGEHGSSVCGPDGTGPGSTTIIEYQCTRNYTSSINGTLANIINTILPIGPCGSSASPGGNIGINAQFKPATPCFDESICAKADALIDALDAVLDTPLTKTQKKRIYEGGTFFKFAETALVAMENGADVDFISDFFKISIITQTHNLPAMQRLITFMRQYGEAEHEIVADYYDSVIEEYDSMTESERQFIHGQLVEIKNDILWAYVNAVVGTVVSDLVIPVVSYALFEAGGSFAIKLLQKIPLPAVLVGTRLENMVRQVGLLGVQGTSNNIRIVTTNGAPYSKGLELFNSLTRNAQSITVTSNGTRVALFNNGNKIVFRTQSSSGFPATLELTFSEIWANTRIVKFQ